MKTFTLHPLITEKSMAKSSDGVYQFIAPSWASKNQIADYVETLFKVTVLQVNTATTTGKIVSFKRKPGQQATYKKATIRLKSGDSIAEFSLPVETTTSSNEKEPQVEEKEPSVKTDSTVTVRSRSKKSGA